jgi:hypothetical protein
MNANSSNSIVELSRSKSRYHDQDSLLRGFVDKPGCTAKEVAVEVLDWKYEQYANAPKRAFDLQALGYLEQLPGRVCRHTGKAAHTYRVTDEGLAHLREVGLGARPAPRPVVDEAPVPAEPAGRRFSDMRKLLGE